MLSFNCHGQFSFEVPTQSDCDSPNKMMPILLRYLQQLSFGFTCERKSRSWAAEL